MKHRENIYLETKKMPIFAIHSHGHFEFRFAQLIALAPF